MPLSANDRPAQRAGDSTPAAGVFVVAEEACGEGGVRVADREVGTSIECLLERLLAVAEADDSVNRVEECGRRGVVRSRIRSGLVLPGHRAPRGQWSAARQPLRDPGRMSNSERSDPWWKHPLS